MTESEFIAIHQSGVINSSGTINVNFDFIPGTTFGRITGLTVTYKPQNDPTSTFTQLVSVLEEVQKIKFKVGATTYSLRIQERRAYPNTANEDLSFYYFKVNPLQFLYNGNEAAQTDVSISLSPFLLGSNITFSDYNPLIDNVLEQRRTLSGSRVFESDRNSITILPSNLEAILSGSATQAAVQESNYTTTGWTNARYNGSTTTTTSYGGIPPALAGTTILSAIYASQTLDSAILGQDYAIAADSRIIESVFHTGKQQLPTYEIASSSYKTNTLITSSSLQVPVVQILTQPKTGSFDINTIIKIDQEKMRVVGYTQNGTTSSLQLTRGLFGTAPALHNGNAIVEIVAPTFIYKYDEVVRKETAVSDAKVWVKETSNIYYTDEFGAVYTGSAYNT